MGEHLGLHSSAIDIRRQLTVHMASLILALEARVLGEGGGPV